MAFFHSFCLFTLVLLAGVGTSHGDCVMKMQECLSGMTNSHSGSDVEAGCKVFDQAKSCLTTLLSSCDGVMRETIQKSLESLNGKLKGICDNYGGGSDDSNSGSVTDSTVDCSLGAYGGCVTVVKKESDICPAYKCINDLKEKCHDKNWDSFMEAFGEVYEASQEKCGCANLKPSLLILIASAILLAFRSRL